MNNFILEDDFLTILDKSETLQWVRPKSDNEVTIANAICLKRVMNLTSKSGTERDSAMWIFSKRSLGQEIPFVGDFLTDETNHSWRIEEVEFKKRIGCWKCAVIDLTLRHRLEERLEWYRPRWILDENGTPYPDYRLERPGIPARIVPIENERFEIFFISRDWKIVYRDCFVTPDNKGYRVLEFHPAKNWNELSRAVTERI